MQKILILILSIFILNSGFVLADDLWDNFGDSNVYGQTPVSEQDFEKALESKKKNNKKIRKNPFFD